MKIHSTSNELWKLAKSAIDLVPRLPQTSMAKEILYFVGLFILTQGNAAGDRFADHLLPWQKKFIISMFHSQIMEVFVKCGKGSGKTVMLASIALAVLMYWASRGMYYRSQIVILSANVAAADILFTHIVEAIGADSDLSELFQTNVAKRELKHKESGITIKITPPTLSNAVGKRPIFLIIDETHQAAIESKDFSAVVSQLRKGGMNWPDFKMINITTAPADSRGASGYYRETLDKARAVRDGKLQDEAFLPVLFEFPLELEDKLDDPNEWWRGMPSLITKSNPKGTMRIEAMQRELKEAVDDAEITGGGSLEQLMSQRLGIEPDERRSGGISALADVWKDCLITENNPAVYKETPRVAVAIDPSPGLNDPAAIAFVKQSGSDIFAESRQFLTHGGYDMAPERIRKVYDAAIKFGELSLHDTPADLEKELFLWVRSRLATEGYAWPICGGDAAGVAGFSARWESKVGTEYKPVPQGWQLMASWHEASALAHSGMLFHHGAPLLAENVRNLSVKDTGSGSRLVKRDGNAAGVGWSKIDGAMALLSAIHLLNEEPATDISGMIG